MCTGSQEENNVLDSNSKMDWPMIHCIMMVHERIPNALFMGGIDEFNEVIDELGLRAALHTKVLDFIRDEGGEAAFIVSGNKLIVQKKKILTYKGSNVRPEPKLRVIRGVEQLRKWFELHEGRR